MALTAAALNTLEYASDKIARLHGRRQVNDRQRDQTRLLIATAEADGRFRLADNHRQVHDNLDGLIAALEDIGDTTP